MTQVVIVPAWQRPEFLRACLYRLSVADRPHIHYLISLDRGYTPGVAQVADNFRASITGGLHRVTVLRRTRHPHRGNSYNVLEAYRRAHAMAPSLIHLVEEDIFVGADYFEYHEDAHRMHPHAFCVSAVRNQAWPPGTEPPVDDTAVYAHTSYQSLGVSFRPDTVRQFLPHAKPAYYRDGGRYLRSVFPHSSIPAGHSEQDGLINRVREQQGAATIYPWSPRAYHAGYFGYNRRGHWNGPGADGSIDERADALLRMSAEQLNVRARHYPDFTTIDLDQQRERVSRTVPWHP